jgi:MinD superfamily P-loop ATPase
MKQIVVLSGKGGTGKTTVTAALGHLIAAEATVVMVDADVDAPNLELILRPSLGESVPFCGGKKAEIIQEDCIQCGRCEEVCRFDAIIHRNGDYQVDPLGCEGCATCYYQCPVQAIRMEDSLSGDWFVSESRWGAFVHARLRPGEANSGLLVSAVRQGALAVATERSADWVLIDGSPGIGCPVIAAVTGTDLALLVSEPTISGIHDLERALQMTEHFRVPAVVCVNKATINMRLAQQIVDACQERGVPVLAQIPYDGVVNEAMRRGLAVTELGENAVAATIRELWPQLVAWAAVSAGGA